MLRMMFLTKFNHQFFYCCPNKEIKGQISKSMSYNLQKIARKTSSLLATRSCLVIIIILFFSYRFCADDFSEMA